MKKPDITPAQIIALVQAVIGALVAFSVDITQEQSIAIVGLVTVIATMLFGADAVIRRGRAAMMAPPPQNITVLDPGAAGAVLAQAQGGGSPLQPVGEGQSFAPTGMHAAGDTPIDDPADAPPGSDAGTRPTA